MKAERRRVAAARKFVICASTFVILISGCANIQYNVATEKEELIFIDTEKEEGLGVSLSRHLEKRYKLVKDDAMRERVGSIGKKIAAVSDRKELLYHFDVLDEKEINAVSLPGGYIYVNRGLMEKVSSDDELACVIAHEVGHVVARHAVKRIQSVLGYNILRVLMAATKDTREVARGADIAMSQVFLAYSREDELLADKLAVKYAVAAGYDPKAMATFLKKLREAKKQKIYRFTYSRTHPYISDRIRTVNEAVYGKMDFTDYMNRDEDLQ